MDKHVTFPPQGVCAHEISFDIVDNRIFKLKFTGGCAGNTQGETELLSGAHFSAGEAGPAGGLFWSPGRKCFRFLCAF